MENLLTAKSLATFFAVLILSALHISFPSMYVKLHKFGNTLVSFSSGVALGYVFLYMLPKLSDYTFLIKQQSSENSWEFMDYRFYLFALVGLVLYFAVDWYSENKFKRKKNTKVFNYVPFIIYSFILGIILVNLPRPGFLPLILATIVLGLHFFGINHQLYQWNDHMFTKYFRWLLTIALIAGWFYGSIFEVSKSFKMSATAFISGAIIANVMFEEISKHKPTINPFVSGIIFFTVVAAVIRSLPKIT